MSVEEFYQTIGVDYKELTSRLPESILKKILLMFLDDSSMIDLAIAISSNDAEGAFRAAHTLKGVCLNLSLKGLDEVAINLTEKLRNLKLDNYKEEYEALKIEYDKIVSLIKQVN